MFLNAETLHVNGKMVGGPGIHIQMGLRMIVMAMVGGDRVARARVIGLVHMVETVSTRQSIVSPIPICHISNNMDESVVCHHHNCCDDRLTATIAATAASALLGDVCLALRDTASYVFMPATLTAYEATIIDMPSPMTIATSISSRVG
jgi:hypothetical protein